MRPTSPLPTSFRLLALAFTIFAVAACSGGDAGEGYDADYDHDDDVEFASTDEQELKSGTDGLPTTLSSGASVTLRSSRTHAKKEREKIMAPAMTVLVVFVITVALILLSGAATWFYIRRIKARQAAGTYS